MCCFDERLNGGRIAGPEKLNRKRSNAADRVGMALQRLQITAVHPRDSEYIAGRLREALLAFVVHRSYWQAAHADCASPYQKRNSGWTPPAQTLPTTAISWNSPRDRRRLREQQLRAGELPALISEVHAALRTVGTPAAAQPPRGEPAVPIKKSITGDYLISLFDGKKYKSLKRHLRTSHDMTPQQYREHWGCPPTTRWSPRTTPRRVPSSQKSMGLGQQRRNAGKKRAKSA